MVIVKNNDIGKNKQNHIDISEKLRYLIDTQ